MKVDPSEAKHSGTELVITNITSLTLLLSATVFLAAVCRFFKRCWKKLKGKRQLDHDVMAFKAIPKSSLYKSHSTSTLNRRSQMIRHEEEIPFDTKEVSVQPMLDWGVSIKDDPMRPRAPTDPKSYRKGERQKSTFAHAQRGSITRSTSRLDITPFDLDPNLYMKEQSLQIFKARSKKKYGMIDMEVYFDAKALELEVKVYSVQHLPSKEYPQSMNTYITIKKLPEKAVQRTSVHPKAINPVFNDEFKFTISKEDDVASHVLMFELHHVDRFSTSYPRGEVRLPLFQLDLSSPRRLLVPFVECRRSFLSTFHPRYRNDYAGCLLVSLKFHPLEDLIVVNPIRVCNVSQKGYAACGEDVYVKVILRHRSTRKTKMKTKSTRMLRMHRTRHYYEARFDEQLNLNLNSTPVQESNIIISLNHYLFFKSSFIIGQVRLSTSEPGYEATHYQSVIDSPGQQISVWYELHGYSTPDAMYEIEK